MKSIPNKKHIQAHIHGRCRSSGSYLYWCIFRFPWKCLAQLK